MHPTKFDPTFVQFRDKDAQNDTEACDPATAPVCGNSSTVSLNQLINYCFIDVSLGLNSETNTYVTQDQVDSLAEICNSVNPDDFFNSGNDKVVECCMKVVIGASSNVTIRRDILMAAGCRSTTHSRNNGDGKMHRPKDTIDDNVFYGQYAHSGRPPFNFDYSSDLLSPIRSSSAANGVNRVCLLPEAFAELNDAECALITQRPIESEVPDKTRDTKKFPFGTGLSDDTDPGDFTLEELVDLPWQCESCIVSNPILGAAYPF